MAGRSSHISRRPSLLNSRYSAQMLLLPLLVRLAWSRPALLYASAAAGKRHSVSLYYYFFTVL
jgi:hypothetical protein